MKAPFNPLPVNVARTAPLDARTTETEPELVLGTQMFAPSKTGNLPSPIVTVWGVPARLPPTGVASSAGSVRRRLSKRNPSRFIPVSIFR